MVRWALISPRAVAECRKPRGQVEHVARRQHGVDHRLALGRGGHLRGAVGPRLGAQRIGEHRLVDAPVLLAGHLQDEDVVDVVVRAEPAGGRRRDVGVDLRRVAQVGGQLVGELDQRRPQPVQALQDDGAAVGEQPQHRVGGHLVADLGAGAPGRGEPLGVDDDAVLGDAQEGRAQPAPGEQLVDGGAGRAGRRRTRRCPRPG